MTIDAIFGLDLFKLEPVLEVPSSGDGVERTLEALAETAKQHNCELVEGDDRTLLLDLDNRHDEQQFDVTMKLLYDNGTPLLIEEIQGWLSKSGRKHIAIRLRNPIMWQERLFLQAMLGSDRSREALTYSRILKNGSDPVVLFRPIGAQVKTFTPG